MYGFASADLNGNGSEEMRGGKAKMISAK